ncbi:MAG: type II secretion system major pseudopilin GspG [Candidatus Omnitrophota bacterium]|nr:type II secretion system major pseudopilin GspG [Candidatus Omnitrophota bacterium]
MQYVPLRRSGFTLIEILLVVVIISALAAMIVPRLSGRSEKAKESIARADVTASIPTALKLYELDNGVYPSTAQGLKALIAQPSGEPAAHNWSGPYIEKRSTLDPWAREYVYRYPSAHGLDYDLYSLGRAGKDDDNVIGNWK